MTVRSRYLAIVATAWLPCLAVAAAFCLLVVRPQIVRGRDLQARLDEAKRQYEVAQAAAKKEDRVRMAAAVETLSNRVNEFTVELEMAPDLLLEIAKLASDIGAESFAMRPRGRQGLDALPGCDLIGEKCIDISFTARFGRFAALLNALERHQPVLFVESFSIDNTRSQSSGPRVDMAVAVLVEKPRGPQANGATDGVK